MYLAEDEVRDFGKCDRCGEKGLEKFKTHIYCVSCNYSESFRTREDAALESIRFAKNIGAFDEDESPEELIKEVAVTNLTSKWAV